MPEKLPLHIGFHYVENDWRMEGREVVIVSRVPGKLERYRVQNVKHSNPKLIGRQTVLSAKNLNTKWDLVPHYDGVSHFDDGGKFHPRGINNWVIDKLEGNTMTSTDGWSFGLPEDVAKKVQVGDALILETLNYSMVIGAYSTRTEEWLWRKSDEELLLEHEEFLEDIKRRDREYFEKNKDDLQRREDALPDWLKGRLKTFHEKGTHFDGMAWGYEIIIAELAVEYVNMGEVILGKTSSEVYKIESEAVKKISNEQGTSGNQHDMALALAKAHLEKPEASMEGTVSGMSPIGGGAYYDR